MLSIPSKVLEARLPGAEEEAAAAEDLPESIGSAGNLGVLCAGRVGAERDSRTVDDPGERLAEYRTTRHGNVGRRSIPTGTPHLQPADLGHAAQQLVAVGILSRSDEREVAVESLGGKRSGTVD